MLKLTIARLLYAVKGLFDDPLELFKALGVEADDWILEVGCAVGYHTVPLATIASEGRIYAVDIWEEALDHLETRAGTARNVEVIRCSADTLEFPRAHFDKIVCFDTLHELSDPGRALAKWATFLKQDGRLLYRDPAVPPERIPSLSEDRLLPLEMVRGVDVFVAALPEWAHGDHP